MQKQQSHQSTLFLDQWLLLQSSSTSQPPPPPTPSSTRAILQSWADLRQNPNPDKLLSSVHALLSSSSTLHVADPHAKLLLSLLPSAPPAVSPSIFRLLYLWTRKSSRPSPSLLSSAVHTLSSAPLQAPDHHVLLLVLGSLSAVPNLPASSRSTCLGKIEKLLPEVPRTPEISPEVLAGIGYSLSRCGTPGFVRNVAPWLLGFWVSDRESTGSVPEGLMVMSLVEWVVGEWMKLRSLQEMDALCEVVRDSPLGAASFAVVMSAAGVLRAFWRIGAASGVGLTGIARGMVEGAVFRVANFVVSKLGDRCELGDDTDMHLLLRCLVLGLARCGPVTFHGDLMVCACLGLLNEVLPLWLSDCDIAGTSDGVLRVKEHLENVLFKEAGAVSGVLCNQYAMANEESRVVVENHMWKYCHEFYLKFRMVSLVLRRKNKSFLQEMEKMAESVFLMVVVFTSQVSRQKLDAKSSITVRSDISVRILVAFSCIEYLRRVRWPEYSDVVRRAVLTLQENCHACTSFLASMPSYSEVTELRGFEEGVKYTWFDDEVQTARLLFYLRVIPTCIANFTACTFTERIAPAMFLYMSHTNEKVSRASHSLFVAFMSSSVKESHQDDLAELKEKLVFYYMERSLEGFPGVTPYEGMASGVVALVRNVPAGSPTIFYCISCLVEKAIEIFDVAIKQDPDLWKNWEADSDPSKKIFELLMRLVSVVDIQVLPHLLKLLAQLVVKLPEEGQRIVLNETYTMVSESDDVIRKPTLVSWLQSLSYLSSQASAETNHSLTSVKNGLQSVNKKDASILSLNRTHSRL